MSTADAHRPHAEPPPAERRAQSIEDLALYKSVATIHTDHSHRPIHTDQFTPTNSHRPIHTDPSSLQSIEDLTLYKSVAKGDAKEGRAQVSSYGLGRLWLCRSRTRR